MSIDARFVFEAIALVLGAYQLYRTKGQAILAWCVVLLTVALLWGRFA